MKNHEVKQILTVGVGLILLFQGVYKSIYGIDSFIIMLQAYSIPSTEYVAYILLFLAHILAPLLLLHGKFINMAGVIILLNILVQISITHLDTLLELTNYGTWHFELPLLYLIIGLTFLFWEDDDCLI